jgi:intracellular sulfur oxidation DsrE/DsrF family protein
MKSAAFLAAVLGLATVTAAFAEDSNFWQNPVVQSAGHMHPLPKAAYQPDAKATYKVVFSVSKGADKPDQINPALDRVARTVNLYASAGVPTNHLQFVAIVSGPATALTLDDEHYKQKFGVANPNLPVIEELKKAGVDVAVCGQAVAESKFEYDWLNPHVTLALSALTTITELEQKGYALMPL